MQPSQQENALHIAIGVRRISEWGSHSDNHNTSCVMVATVKKYQTKRDVRVTFSLFS